MQHADANGMRSERTSLLNHDRVALSRVPFVLALLLSVAILFTPASGVPPAFPGTDKIVHLLLFAALTWTARIARCACRAALLGMVFYAVGSEIAQALLPLGRSGDWTDILADVLGGLGGLAVHRWTRWLIHRFVRGEVRADDDASAR